MSLALAHITKSLHRVALKTMHFLYFAPRQENVQLNAKEGYNLELRKFKGCKLLIFEKHDPE